MEEKPIYLERTRLKLQLAKDIHDKFEVKICDQNSIIYPHVLIQIYFLARNF